MQKKSFHSFQAKQSKFRLTKKLANNNYDQKDTYTHVVKTRRGRALKLLIDKNPTLYYCTLFSEKSVKNVKFLLQFYSSSPPVALNAKSTAAAAGTKDIELEEKPEVSKLLQ